MDSTKAPKEEDVKCAEEETTTTTTVVESEDTQRTSTNPSDYDDSADGYSEDDDVECEGSEHSGSTSDRSVVLEREEGDGQESAPTRKIDDDEDKKNPQYIPKRGTFYEHDDRTIDDEEKEEEEKEKLDKEGKKKIWTDKKEKWSHDKFNDNDQAPKSRAELIAIYGYDIRNEDGPPRARRRRRYGRGPNKYTRNWEDEDAYSKPPLVARKPTTKKPRSVDGEPENQVERQNIKNSEEGNSSSHSVDSQNERALQPTQVYHSNTSKSNDSPRANPPPSHVVEKSNKGQQQRVGTGRVVKQSREIKDSDYRGFTKPRQFAQKPQKDIPKEHRENIQSQQYVNKRGAESGLEKDMAKMSLQEQHGKGGAKHGGGGNASTSNRQTSVPPRMQNEQKGSKRYSSIRQRSLPEAGNPPFNQQHNFYGNEYNQQGNVPATQQPQPQLIQHQPPVHTNPPQMPTIAPPPLPTLPQQVPVTSTPLPPQFGTPFPQPPPPFLQPAPPPFIPQQTGPIINYVPGLAPPQPPYQGYQQTFNPVSQPTEIFQPPGGITYYNADQQTSQRPSLQKRPKAAIPIVPPPPLEPRGRGRTSSQEMASPGSAEMPIEIGDVETSAAYEDVAVQQ